MAQTAGSPSISGKVLDPSGALVPDATVQLQRPAGRAVQTGRTDLSGAFQFSAVSPGTYSIRVQHSGFKDAVTQVQVTSRPRAPLNIRLELADLFFEVSADFEPVQVSTAISENRDAASVDNNLMEKLPVFDQDYVARMSAFLDAGSIGTGGVLAGGGRHAGQQHRCDRVSHQRGPYQPEPVLGGILPAWPGPNRNHHQGCGRGLSRRHQLHFSLFVPQRARSIFADPCAGAAAHLGRRLERSGRP